MIPTLIWLDKETGKTLEFDKWMEINDDELYIYFAETGVDRELCFDSYERAEEIYEAGSTP